LIRNDPASARHIAFCNNTPVKLGLGPRVHAWPHSTAHRDVARVFFPLDWAGDPAPDGEFGEPS
jgi:putative transposase